MLKALVLVTVVLGTQLECDEVLCPEAWRGDGFCDLPCNIAPCGFDSMVSSDSSDFSYVQSDCYDTCAGLICAFEGYQTPCVTISSFGNGECWQFGDTDYCGWDAGLCGYCAHHCYAKDLGDGICKAECNNLACHYDAGDCGYCSSGCYEAMLGDGVCQEVCLTSACEYDRGDCAGLICSPGCLPGMVGDGECQETCHHEACQWDLGDCDCSEGCSAALLSNAQCDPACNNPACGFDGGVCGDCAAGCFTSMIGNGECEEACFTAECRWDEADCGCAANCHYWEIAQCKAECLVLDCGYGVLPGYASCGYFPLRDVYKFQNIATFWMSGLFPAHDPSICPADAVPYIYYACYYYGALECLYNFGVCNPPTDTCWRTFFWGCLQCAPGLLNSAGFCHAKCAPSLSPHPLVPDLCTPMDLTTSINPQVYYIDGGYGGGDSDGSQAKPFTSLDEGLIHCYHRHVKLLPNCRE